MDYKFLNKVVDQIVSETKIVDRNEIFFPFFSVPLLHPPSQSMFLPFSFSNHCKNIYGLNDDEVKYVWKQYKRIINDKIKNG